MTLRTKTMLGAVAGAATCVLACGAWSRAAAQAPPAKDAAANVVSDVVVTARKRNETSISVPVTVEAVGGVELKQRAMNSVDDIAELIPQLLIGQGGVTQGGEVSFRGIIGPSGNPFTDQTVSFNIDGVQVAKASIRRLSDMDVSQVEVLEGPQALFFGKNSPAGIISIRTNDPTPTFKAGLNVGYEVVGHEIRSEGYISGPITDALGFRLAGYVSDMSGYLSTVTPAGAYVASTTVGSDPKATNYALRLTLKYDPNDRLNALFKLGFSHLTDSGSDGSRELIACPTGRPQTGMVLNCGAGSVAYDYGSGPLMAASEPIYGNGANFDRDSQILGSLEIDYKLTSALKLTSVTGFYNDQATVAANFGDANVLVPSANPYLDRSISEELRLQSSFGGWMNFTVGTNLSWTHAYTRSPTFLFAANAAGEAVLDANGLGFIPILAPFQIQNYALVQNGQAYSVFGQLQIYPIPTVEFDAGGRYSYEGKQVPVVQNQPFGYGDPFGYNPLVPANDIPPSPGFPERAHWDNFSPEFTLSYRPSGRLTLYASYKEGFVSGGFNAGGTSFSTSLVYNPMTVKGPEVGLKALLFDGSLRLNAAGYLYDISGLQTSQYVGVLATIGNAAAAQVRGVEINASYHPPVEGLRLNGSLSYNFNKYTSYTGAPCYNGQTNGMGCFANPAGISLQDLSGRPLPDAPNWAMNAGFDYERPIGSDNKIGLSASVKYSSNYFSDVSDNPLGIMPDYTMVDSSVRLIGRNDRWEFAVIGSNLLDVHYWVQSQNAFFTGTAAGLPTGVLGDQTAFVSRGRQVMLRMSYNY